MVNNNDFLRWEVKPLWILRYPSIMVGTTTQKSIEIYGVNRTVGDIVRNWEKIHSVEQFNQGYIAKPEDITYTIAIKEHGDAFEVLRRLSKGAILFDIECSIVDLGETNSVNLENIITPTTPGSTKSWLDGFERFIGCIVNRSGQTIDIAEFPVREFECMALRHAILDTIMLIEGDGTYPAIEALTKANEYIPITTPTV